MKKLIVVTSLLMIACAGILTIHAQVPASRTLGWDANPPADEVTTYTISANNGPKVNVSNQLDASCNCITSVVVFPTTGMYTFSITAVNQWGESPPAIFSVEVKTPGKSGNVRIVR